MLFIFNSEMEVPVRLVHDRSSRIKKKQLQTFYWFRYNRIKRREGAVLEAGRGNLCFVDRASLINLVNKDNLVYNFFKYVNFFSTCFLLLCAHLYTRQSSTQSNKYQVSHRYSYFS